MRRFIAVATFASAWLFAAALAIAADKGGPAAAPAAPAGTIVAEKPFASGLYLEGSAAAANFRVAEVGTESFQMFGLGLGYDHRLGDRLILGASARYNLTRNGDGHAIDLGARLGFLANPHLLLYVPLTYTLDAENIDIKNGIWSVGAGIETAVLVNNLALFAEATRNFALQGDAKWIDEAYFFRAGVRLRF